ncbi:MAG: hypothetical protein AAF490_07855 [Chloroflexota bacterium]
MNNRWIFILMAGVLLSPVCCASTYLVDESSVTNHLFKFMLFALVWGGFFLLIRWLGKILWTSYHAPKAAMLLAEEMGLSPLNQKDDPKYAFYGGSFQGVPFAITPVRYTFRYNLDGESRVRFEVLLRIVIPVKNEMLSGSRLYRSPHDRSKAESFRTAFPKVNKEDAISDNTKNVMLEFVQKGFETKSRSSFFRRANLRNLGLLDRQFIGEGQIDETVFADTPVFLIHDHPNPLSMMPEHLETILSEMIDIVKMAEKT